MSVKKKIFMTLGVLVLLSILIIAIQTIRYDSLQLADTSEKKSIAIQLDEDQAIQNLSAAIQHKTISYQDMSQIDEQAFLSFHQFLETQYPTIHKVMSKQTISDLSLLYKWEGTDPDLDPLILAAHMDVVPIAEGDEWEHDPFSGFIGDEYVWGRGTIDMKSQLVGIMEAMEALAKTDFKPQRTIYLAFGHDEEVSGAEGAAMISKHLEAEGIKASLVLDEGGFVVDQLISDIDSPVALIGIAEKGYLTLKLTATDKGGHSSLPPRHTAVGTLAAAIYTLENSPFDATIKGPTELFLDHIGPEMPLLTRMLFANDWLTQPLLKSELAKSPNTDALLRTTIAATMIQGGEKENVLPQEATAYVNFRILPGETVETVTEHVRTVIDNSDITIEPVGFNWNPSEVSDIESEQFRTVQRSIQTIYPDALTAPYLVVGATDSRYYQTISNHVFRLSPMKITQTDLDTMHGTNERISKEGFMDVIRFYHEFVTTYDQYTGE